MTREHLWLHPVGRLPILALLQVVLVTSSVSGIITEWTGADGDGGSGAFQNILHWDAGIPGVGDLAKFFEIAFPTVTFTQDEASDELQILAGSVTFVSDSALLRTYALTTGAADVLVQGGTLNIGSATNPVFLNVGDLIQIGNTLFDSIVFVEGSQSRLDVLGAGTHNIGFGGGEGQLFVISGATATIGTGGTINVGVSSINSTIGSLEAADGGTISLGSLAIGTNISGAFGFVTVINIGSSITQAGGSTLAIGSASGGTGRLSVFEGTFTSGTGAITLNATGTINIQNNGTFNAAGLLTMNSGSTLTLDGGSLNAASGLDNSANGTLDFRDGTLTVTGGAFVPNAGGPSDDYLIDGPTGAEMPHLVLGAGATANIGGDLIVGFANNGTLDVQNGADVTNTLFGTIGFGPSAVGTVTVDGAGSTWLSSLSQRIGDFGQGTLNITNGGHVTSGSNGLIGFQSNSVGEVNVDGSDPNGNASTWTIEDDLTIGFHGDGTLRITNGGKVSNVKGDLGCSANNIVCTLNDGTGTVIVDGVGSTWTNIGHLRLGLFGGGTVDVLNGGTLISNNGHILKNSTITVAGVGSTWMNSGLLSVGDTDEGVLNVLNGGEVENTFSKIGANQNTIGTVTVDGVGSKWTNSGQLDVGILGVGTLNIQNGGEVISSTGFLGGSSLAGSMGTVTVDGAGSTWTNSSNLTIGEVSTGVLDILNGGNVSNASGFIGNDPNSTGTVTVDGSDPNGNASTWTNSSDLFVGGSAISAGGTGALNVQNNALVEVDGALKIWAAGTINLDGGALNANAGLDNSEGTLNFSDGTLTVTGGAFVPNAGGPTDDYLIDGPTASEMPHLVLGAGATANIGGDFSVGNVNRGELTVADGGTVSNTTGTIGSASSSTGMVTVDGTGSIWTNAGNLFVGDTGNGTLNIQNGGAVSNTAGTIGRFSSSTSMVTVDGSDPNGNASTWTNTAGLIVGRHGNGTLNILGGGAVSNTTGTIGFFSGSTGMVTVDGTDSGNASTWTNSSPLNVAVGGNGTLNITGGGAVSSSAGSIGLVSGSTGMVTVDGAGSTWTNTFTLHVGGGNLGPGGTGSLSVEDQGLVDAGNELEIFDTGTVTLDGGTIITQTLDIKDGGTFNFIVGSLTVNSGIEVGSGNLFPVSFTLNSDRHLATAGTTTISAFRTLTLDGGSLQTGNLAINGTLQFNSGTLGITGAGGLTVGAGGPLGAALTVGAGQTIDVTNTATVDSGATLVIASGGAFNTGTLANGGSVILNGAAALLGGTTLSNNSGGIVRGEGTISATVNNNAGGEIRAEAGKTLLLTAAPGTNSGQINLQEGTLQFSQALTNGSGGNILGRGTLIVGGAGLTNTGDLALSNGQTDIFGDVDNQTTGQVIISGNADVTFWDDVTDSGTLFNVSTGSSVTFFGTAGFGISGGGDVYMEADVTPGASPGLETFGGNVHFGVLANLEIEIAGTTLGTQYDALNIAGLTTLDGTLTVSLLSGFMPTAGDMFEIISAASVIGTFATETLPALAGGLEWFVNYSGTSVELISTFPGDFDFDGDVDGADFLEWQRGLGTIYDATDLADWEMNYGMVAPLSASSAAVPEPNALALLCLGGLLALRSFRRATTFATCS